MSLADKYNKLKQTMADKYLSFSEPMADKYNKPKQTMADKYTQQEPQEQHTDPRSKLSNQQVKEAEANKQGVLGSFTKGFTHNFDEYASSVNKGLDWVADGVTGRDTKFFEDNTKFWNDKRRQNEIETEAHPYAKLGGKILLDPINFMPLGVASKATKLKAINKTLSSGTKLVKTVETTGSKLGRIAKSSALGVPIGYATMSAKNLGNDSISTEQKQEENKVSAGLVGVLNGVVAGFTKGRVKEAFRDGVDVVNAVKKGRREIQPILDTLRYHPENFDMSPRQAKDYADELSGLIEKESSPKGSEALDMLLKNVHKKSSPLPLNYGKNTPLLPAPKDVQPNVIHAGWDNKRWQNSDKVLPIEINPYASGKQGRTKGSVALDNLIESAGKKSSKLPDNFNWEGFADEYHAGDSHIYDMEGRQITDNLIKNEDIPKPELLREKSNADPIQNWEEKDFFDDFTPQEKDFVTDKADELQIYNSSHDEKFTELIKTINRSRKPQVLKFKKLLDENPIVRHIIASAETRYSNKAGIDSVSDGKGYRTFIEQVNSSTPEIMGAKSGKIDIAGDNLFSISKADYNNIMKGNITDDILTKLKNDVATATEHPNMEGYTEKIIEQANNKPLEHSLNDYNVAHENLSISEITRAGEQQGLALEGTQNPLFTTESTTELAVPKWAKPLVSDTTRYEDIVKAVTDAKNGKMSELADKAVSAMKKDSEMMPKFKGAMDDVNPNTLFSNAGQNMAVGFGVGTANAGGGLFDGSYDPNRDLSEQMGERFIQGMIAGTAGVGALKLLRNTNPKAFEKVRSWVADNDIKVGDTLPTDGVKIGAFGGATPSPQSQQGRSVLGSVVSKIKNEITSFRSGFGRGKTGHVKDMVDDEINKDWRDISGGLAGDANRLWRNTFSGKYLDARSDMQALKLKAGRVAENLHLALKELPDSYRNDIHNYIVGDTAPQNVTQEIREIGDNIKNTINDIREELRDNDFPEEMLDAWGDKYLKRSYEQHLGKDALSLMSGKLTKPQVLKRGKREHLTQDEIQAKMATGELDPNMQGLPLSEGGWNFQPSTKHRDKFEVVRDWTKTEREAMNEITDASVTVPQTIMYMSQMLEHSKFLDEAKGIDGVILPQARIGSRSDADLDVAGFVRVAKDDKFGALAGQVIRKDVYDDITALNDTMFNTTGGRASETWRVWKDYLNTWKKSKTVWNAPTHFNNVTANLYLMHLAGLNSIDIGKNFTNASSMMMKAGRMKELERSSLVRTLHPTERAELSSLQNNLKYYREAEEHGLLNTSMLEDMGGANTANLQEKGMLGKLDDFASKAYQNEDAVGKLTMFKFLREDGWTAKDAKRAVQMVMPDYSTPMAVGWKRLRDFGATPFIAWTYYTFPKIYHMMKSGKGLAQAVKGVGALYGISYALTGEMPNDVPHDFVAKRFPVMKQGDEVTSVKMDRINPALQFMNPLQTGRELIGSGLIQQASGLINGVKMYNGRPITNENKPIAHQLYDKSKYFAQTFIPFPQQGYAGLDLIETMIRDKKNRTRSQEIIPRTLPQELLRQVGINSITHSERGVKRKRTRQINRDKKNGFW